MKNFNEAQSLFIEKLEKCQDVFKQIREKDRRREIIRYETRERFDKLVRAHEMLLEKLKLREFSVAVVGLEKAGKSTLANALLSVVLLPEYTERCTYTTTEIRAGNEDIAEIYFFSKEKFKANFQRLLKDTGWTGEETFDDFDLRKFERYWSEVKTKNPSLFQQHNGTTVEDIRMMANERDAINYLVGKPPEFLHIKTAEGYEQFHRYVTGIADYESGHVIRSAEPYAVEKVVIKSTGLRDMQHIVLYDVPGFDSPTELHKKQTEQMLKEADAIILVTNVGDRPNLTGTQLDMLKKGQDDDGITLSDKVFVFGNKLDMAGNARIAADNQAALVHDSVSKYALAKKERVICGSAKAYLESIGKQSQDDIARGSRNAGGKLREWNFSDGIEELRTKLQRYYDNERFEILARRAENGIAKAKDFFDEILSKYERNPTEEIDGGEKYILQAKDSLEDFSRKAGTIGRDFLQRINDEMPFSSLLRDGVEEIFPTVTSDSQIFRDAENGISSNSDNVYALNRVDSFVREKLHMEFKKNIVLKVATATHAKEAEIFDALTEEFLLSMGMAQDSPDRQVLTERTKELFQKLLIADGEHCYFNPLVERYSPTLIEALIKCPFASIERLQKLTSPVTMPELQSLAVYYEKPVVEDESDFVDTRTLDEKQMTFFARILTHEDFNSPAVEENELALRNFFQENSGYLTAGFDTEKLPFGMWASLLTNLHVNVTDELLPRITKALTSFVGLSQWVSMSTAGKNNQVDRAIINFCAELKPASFTEKLSALNDTVRGATNKDEMISVLNADIELLQEITLNSMIRAIGLERAFTSVIAKNIAMIRESIDSDAGKEIFNQWLKENLRKIRASEFADVDKQIEDFRNKKVIVESIRQLLEKMEE